MPDTQTPVRIVIADDHPLVREGLRRLLDLQPGFAVVGEAADGLDAVKVVKDVRPNVLLLDLAMPLMNGLEVLRELGEIVEGVKTVLLTAGIEREETLQALRLGARGVVLKESATQLLYKCIRAVMNGEYWVGHGRIDDLLKTMREVERAPLRDAPPASRLTLRELQVIAAVVEGAGNKDIGKTLGLSEQTVKNHLSNIFDKLGVSNRLELALYAVHHRLLAGQARERATAGGPAQRRSKPPGRRLKQD
jgi:two-component system nitrate/nitrite response regulator NarL